MNFWPVMAAPGEGCSNLRIAKTAKPGDFVSMKSAIEEKRLKRLVKEAVGEAFQTQKRLIQSAVIEAIEDIALVRAMEEADEKPISEEKVNRLLRRGRESRV
jgi:hypothetical protein